MTTPRRWCRPARREPDSGRAATQPRLSSEQRSMTDAAMDPWLRGPYQLIEHANGHLKAANDADRIIALIGFDQAIEVCVDVFINLHPRLRGNYQVQRDEAEKAL